jgi:hypothetical protein
MARRFTEAERIEIWERLALGESGSTMARVFGRFPSAIYTVQRVTGGVRPAERRRRKDALTLTEREEISRGLASKETYRTIAARLHRAPSTVCREVQRNAGPARYRACAAERRTLQVAHRHYGQAQDVHGSSAQPSAVPHIPSTVAYRRSNSRRLDRRSASGSSQ